MRTVLRPLIAVAALVACAVPSLASAAGTATVPTRHLPAKGGTVKWAATVHNAKTCTWSSSPKVVAFGATVKCKSGVVTHSFEFGANTSTKAKDYTLNLVVRGTITTVDHLKVVEAGKTTSTTTTVPPTTTTTTLPPSSVVITPGAAPDQPTGIVTFGDAPPSAANEGGPVGVSTDEILGYASFSALSVSNDLTYPAEKPLPVPNSLLSLQLETVLQVQSGSTKYLYLIQNGPAINTSPTMINVGSDVWGWGTSTQTPATNCAQLNKTVTYEMDNVSGESGTVFPTGTYCSPYGYGSAASISSYQLPLSIVVGTKVVGNQVVLFYEIPGSAPVIWDTLTFSFPDETLSLIASTSAGGVGVGSAAFYIGGPGGGESAVFSAISGELGLYYLDGSQVVPFSDIENASSRTTTVPEGTANAAVGIGSDGFLTLTEGTPTGLTDAQFNPPVPPALAAAAVAEMVSTAALPSGTAGSPYSEPLSAIGGVAPYTWSVTEGSLPPGIALNGSTLSGTPTLGGVFSFTVTVSDSSDPPRTATRSFSLAIADSPSTPKTPPTISLSTPVVNGMSVSINGGTVATMPTVSIVSISWNWGDGTTSSSFFPGLHTYAAAGTYTVTATATDSNGLSASVSTTVQIGT
jgi:hypothetical protein